MAATGPGVAYYPAVDPIYSVRRCSRL